MTDHPERVRVMRPILKFLGPNYIFGMNEARHFKFGVQIDTYTDACMMDDRLPPIEMWPGLCAV